ncbi:hypothetical protein CLOSTASPAR_01790 [[Clostridium] asparagiforme DSM 15981]|uniref:Uncharacterized protein n=1 Tax=[Clostridium] asparagiforme DSM 15981 TaxID=518636 RepID=C0CXR5_9FIRM|nr:hypothetical protein CLOSTASPAR_01790 [[Clostridium] asparagiforme DSM 15981]
MWYNKETYPLSSTCGWRQSIIRKRISYRQPAVGDKVSCIESRDGRAKEDLWI